MGKVRIYDLAKELKLESKKILEDARRMGVDVNVASNSLDDVIAAKIRETYYPKKEQAVAPRTARLIKHHPSSAATAPATTTDAPANTDGSPAISAETGSATTSHALDSSKTSTTVSAEAVRSASKPAATPTQETTVRTITPPAARPQSAPSQLQPLEAAPSVSAEPPSVAAEAPEAEPTSRVVKLSPTPYTAVPLAEAPELSRAPSALLAEAGNESVEAVSAGQDVAPKVETEPEVSSQAELDPGTRPATGDDRPIGQPATGAPAPIANAPAPPPRSAGTGSNTKITQLATPTRPMPKPQPPPSAPRPTGREGRVTGSRTGQPGQSNDQPGQFNRTGQPPQGRFGQQQFRPGQRPDQQGRPGQQARPGQGGQGGQAGQTGQAPGAGGRDVHLLPSGAQQRTVYIPPRDQRPKGRNQQKGKDTKDKFQEGHQPRIGQRARGSMGVAVAPAARQAPVDLKPLRVVEGSTVREFAEKIDAKPRDIVTALMQRGVMATINQTINHDFAVELGKEYGWDITFGDFEDMIIESEFEITPEAMEDTDPRAPVITVMGHVDHGKTSLLDAIRSTRVAEGEAGGITQHIGAYSVAVPNPEDPKDIRRVVFLDTPGHEAFTMMRARGAKVTDIVVLVVAADDGVMPQTIEAIEHAKAANVPIIVAINKIDKGDANPERVKKELADRGLLWDSWGGSTTMVEVSAKMRQNINGLLEMILLTADILDLKANPTRMATGTVLEAKLDRGRGAMATVLIQNGTLHIGEPLIVGNFYGKVRALVNDRGDRVLESGPATPVEVLGLEGVPAAGDQFQVVDDVAKAQQISQLRQSKARITSLSRTAARGLDQLAAQMETGEVKELLVILKADVQGSVEVLKDTLVKLSTDKVKVRIIRSGVGAITYDDVLLASASNATETGAATVIIGFNVRPESRADEIAKQESVDIRLHSIIYKVEEEIRNSMIGLMDATLKDVVLGKAEVREIIRVPRVGSVAGCMVINGSIKRTAQARLIRNNVVIFESAIGSLRRFKDDTSEVQQGYECGITIDRFNDFRISDVIEAFIVEKVAATHL